MFKIEIKIRRLTSDEYFNILKGVLWGVLVFAAFMLVTLFSSCKLFKEVSKSSTDSTSVSRTAEAAAHVDSSKSLRESAYEKTSYYFPRDTSVVNNHIYPTAIIHEKGTAREQVNNYIYDTSWKAAFDSINVKLSSKEKVEQVKTPFLHWVVLCAVGVLLLKSFLPKFKIEKG